VTSPKVEQTNAGDGSVGSSQRARLERPVVPFSIEGALALGRSYWPEVERCTAGLVRVRPDVRGIALRLLGDGPALLRFGDPELEADAARVVCRYAIRCGALVRRPGGSISFEQVSANGVELCSTITGFYPRLAAKPGAPHWTGTLYNRVQSRIHEAIGRRYFRALQERATR